MVCEVYKQGVGQYVNVVLDWFGLAASRFLYICVATDRVLTTAMQELAALII
jgi:hypothetical protein